MKLLQQFIVEAFIPPSKRDIVNETQGRINFIDLAKGICVIMMVLVHVDEKIFNPSKFEDFILPIFFVMSGYFFKPYKFGTFITKKINYILIPFLFWVLLVDLWHLIHIPDVTTPSIMRFIDDPFYHFIEANGPLWFLLSLFYVNMIFYLITIIFQDIKFIFLASVLFGFIGFLLDSQSKILPLWIDSAFSSLPYFFFGYACNKKGIFEKNISISGNIIIGISLIVLSYLICIPTESSLNLWSNIFGGNSILSYLCGIGKVTGILFICKGIQWLPLVSYFGRYTMIILCTHYPLLTYIPHFYEKHFGIILEPISLAVIIMVTMCIAVMICKTYLPHVSGLKPIIKWPESRKSQKKNLTALNTELK